MCIIDYLCHTAIYVAYKLKKYLNKNMRKRILFRDVDFCENGKKSVVNKDWAFTLVYESFVIIRLPKCLFL
jgi:hypothetical protein